MNQRVPQTPTQAAYERWRNRSNTPPGYQPTPKTVFEAAFLAGQVHALKEAAERVEFLWGGPVADPPFERSERALIEWLKTQAQKLCPVCVGWSVSGEEGRGGSCTSCGKQFHMQVPLDNRGSRFMDPALRSVAGGADV
jgi:hypothetical protein